MAAVASAPRRAATIAVVRDAPAGIEVLLLRRIDSADHTSGAWVFPGGVIDAEDGRAHDRCSGVDAVEASRRLGLEQGGLDHYVAAVRECFEEAGLLFAADAGGQLVRFDPSLGTAAGNDHAHAPRSDDLASWREPLHHQQSTLAQLCDTFGLTLALDRLAYLSHWVTPLGRKRRFDTWFFVAEAPAGQTAAFDGAELVEQVWCRPEEAVARAEGQADKAFALLPPTLETLKLIGRFDRVNALMAWARSPREIKPMLPRDGSGRQGVRVVLPDEPAWAELGRIDPDGRGNGRYDIEPERPVRLSPRVIRVTAANPGVMTGSGTNTYLVGGSDTGPWAVLDPGPDDPDHLAAILAAAPGPIGWIFVTHTHLDHSPGAAALKARTGAPVLGRRPDHLEWQDDTFAPDVLLRGGERVVLPGPPGATTTLEAIHTPGHASNHLCYLLADEKLLFTGDHLMQASTVVINPPDGDMGAYLASLRELAGRDLEWLAPGHGFLMAEPRRTIEAVIAHRLRREAKVIDALRAQSGPADADSLLALVYDDVQPRVLGLAMRSLLAHLLKLRDEGRASETGGRWAPTSR